MQYFHFITPKLVSVFARHARAHRDAGCFYPMFDHTKETLILCCFFTNRHTAMLVIQLLLVWLLSFSFIKQQNTLCPSNVENLKLIILVLQKQPRSPVQHLLFNECQLKSGSCMGNWGFRMQSCSSNYPVPPSITGNAVTLYASL